MSTSIPAVDTEVDIASNFFIDLTLGDTTYYISDAYKDFTVNSNTYTSLGVLMNVDDFKSDYKATQGSNQIAISGIPNTVDYLNIIQSSPIRGGNVTIRRKFFYAGNSEPIANAEYVRFEGIISNYHIDEETSYIEGQITDTLVFDCVTTYNLVNNKYSGQETNGSARRSNFTDSIDFDNVKFITTLPEFDK